MLQETAPNSAPHLTYFHFSFQMDATVIWHRNCRHIYLIGMNEELVLFKEVTGPKNH